MENSIEELKTNYEQNPIFEFFSQDEFDRFLDITQPITYKKEEVIFETGQEPRGLYVITEGRVQITQNKAGKPARILAEIKAPTVLGEMALLEKRHRTSTATSLTKTTVLFLDKCKFMELLEQDELMAFKLSHNLGKILTQKIEAMNNAMMDMKQQFKEFSNFKNSLFSDWNF